MPQYRQEKVTHGCSASAAGSTAGVSEQKSSLGQEISDAQRGFAAEGRRILQVHTGMGKSHACLMPICMLTSILMLFQECIIVTSLVKCSTA